MRHAFAFVTWPCACPWLGLLAILLCCAPTRAQEPPLDDAWTFRTRPDIEAPRFHITRYNETVSPGYWFIASYDFLEQSLATGGHWTAPQIYDGSGRLIWSGSYLSRQYNTFDFRMSNVLGEQMMTWMYPRNRTAIAMDTQYRIRHVFQISDPDFQFDNMHDLLFVDNGTRALYFYDEIRSLSRNASVYVGFTDGNCFVRENSFDERDMAEDKIVFSWSSSDHIDLKDSTYTKSMQNRCRKVTDTEKGWDFIHANSIDKFPDGSGYLLSGRHTDSIYKINPDKTIAWKLGDPNNDFESDFKFARQHHARIVSVNSSHTIISFFDNAMAEDMEVGVARYSRGLVVALHHDIYPMTATMLAEYPHPDRHYTLGRASTQLLPNGNVFMGWVDACLLSEHSADGIILMEARIKQEWLKTYRAYKFDFKGFPSQPPDVLAEVSRSDDGVRTQVLASWNGATEVATWKLYKTTATGKNQTHLLTRPRQNFEEQFTLEGYAKYIMVEALDRDYNVLGQSKVLKTTLLTSIPADIAANEEKWLRSHEDGTDDDDYSPANEAEAVTRNSSFWILTFWAVVAVSLILLGRILWRAKRRDMRWWKIGEHSYKLLNVVANGHDQRTVLEHESDDGEERGEG